MPVNSTEEEKSAEFFQRQWPMGWKKFVGLPGTTQCTLGYVSPREYTFKLVYTRIRGIKVNAVSRKKVKLVCFVITYAGRKSRGD